MRTLLLYLIIVLVGLVFIIRLFYLQIYDSSTTGLAADNAIKIVYDYPNRGFVFDRNGELMVENQPSYDVMAIPREIKSFDTLEFCQILRIKK